MEGGEEVGAGAVVVVLTPLRVDLCVRPPPSLSRLVVCIPNAQGGDGGLGVGAAKRRPAREVEGESGSGNRGRLGGGGSLGRWGASLNVGERQGWGVGWE